MVICLILNILHVKQPSPFMCIYDYTVFYYVFLLYSLKTPKYCQHFFIPFYATNNINLTRI